MNYVCTDPLEALPFSYTKKHFKKERRFFFSILSYSLISNIYKNPKTNLLEHNARKLSYLFYSKKKFLLQITKFF